MAEQNLDIVIRVRGGTVASQEIKQVGESTKAVGTATEDANKKTSGLRRTMAGLASGFAVYKGYNFIKGAVSETANLAKATAGLQRVTGLDTRTAAGWVDMAQQRGIQSKALNQGFITLNRQISAAASGSKSANQAFGKLGLDAVALKAAPAQQRMGMLADAFSKVKNPVDKATLAQKLFGRQSQGMLPILGSGSKAMNEQVSAYAKSVGMTDNTKKAALEFAASQRELNSNMTGVKVAIGSALMPIIVQLAQVITPIVQAFAQLMQHSSLFRYAVIALTAALVVFVAVLTVGSAAVAGWIALAVGIAAALYLAYQHVGWFRAAVDALKTAGVAAFNAIKGAAVAVFNWIKTNWPLLVQILFPVIGSAAVLIIKNFNNIRKTVGDVISFISGVIKGVAGVISGVLGGAFNTLKGIVSGALSVLKEVADVIGKIVSAPKNIISGAVSFAKSIIPGIQTGGTVMHGGVAVVGEAGPELVNLPTGSQVIPNHALGGIGGGAARIVVPVYLDSRQIALAMGDYTADRQAAR